METLSQIPGGFQMPIAFNAIDPHRERLVTKQEDDWNSSSEWNGMSDDSNDNVHTTFFGRQSPTHSSDSQKRRGRGRPKKIYEGQDSNINMYESPMKKGKSTITNHSINHNINNNINTNTMNMNTINPLNINLPLANIQLQHSLSINSVQSGEEFMDFDDNNSTDESSTNNNNHLSTSSPSSSFSESSSSHQQPRKRGRPPKQKSDSPSSSSSNILNALNINNTPSSPHHTHNNHHNRRERAHSPAPPMAPNSPQSVRSIPCFYHNCTYCYKRPSSTITEFSDRPLVLPAKFERFTIRSCKKHHDKWKNIECNAFPAGQVCEVCRNLNKEDPEEIVQEYSSTIQLGLTVFLCHACVKRQGWILGLPGAVPPSEAESRRGSTDFAKNFHREVVENKPLLLQQQQNHDDIMNDSEDDQRDVMATSSSSSMEKSQESSTENSNVKVSLKDVSSGSESDLQQVSANSPRISTENSSEVSILVVPTNESSTTATIGNEESDENSLAIAPFEGDSDEARYFHYFERIDQFNHELLPDEERLNSAFEWFIKDGYQLLDMKSKVTIPIDKRIPAKKGQANNFNKGSPNINISGFNKNPIEWGYVAQLEVLDLVRAREDCWVTFKAGKSFHFDAFKSALKVWIKHRKAHPRPSGMYLLHSSTSADFNNNNNNGNYNNTTNSSNNLHSSSSSVNNNILTQSFNGISTSNSLGNFQNSSNTISGSGSGSNIASSPLLGRNGRSAGKPPKQQLLSASSWESKRKEEKEEKKREKNSHGNSANTVTAHIEALYEVATKTPCKVAEILPRDLVIQSSGPRLGEGRHGVLHKGYWQGYPVAVRFPRVPLPISRQARSEFVKTVNRSAIVHPNIVTAYACCVSEPHPLCLVFEYMNLGSLQRWLEQSVSTLSAALDQHLGRIAMDVARPLAFLHAKGVLHCGIRPKNVLMRGEMVDPALASGLLTLVEVKLSDVGFNSSVETAAFQSCLTSSEDLSNSSTSIAANASSSSSSANNAILMDPYLAPEVVKSQMHTPASDVYALGMLLAHLCSPAGSVVPLPVQRLISTGTSRATSLFSAGYRDLITQCVNPIPEQRPSAAEVLQRLTRLTVPSAADFF